MTYVAKIFHILFLIVVLLYSCFAQSSRRDKSMRPELIMDTIGVKPGMIIGEVGAGEGYFTFKLSDRVGPEGKIYANDIKKSVLESIEEKSEEKNIENISVVKGETEDPLFPENELDMIVMMLVYHDLEKPVIFFRNLKKYLKPEANVVIIDRDPDRWGEDWDHFMTKKEILESVKKSDYELVGLETFLERDNIYIFRPKKRTTKSTK
jgi:ubiquinone/menaquinone biosynthesis C-methylase UbiE